MTSRSDGVGAHVPIVVLAMLVAFGPMSIDMYLPSFPTIARSLQTDVDTVQISLSLFFAGFAIGQLFLGPLSDVIGRRPVLLGGIAIYILASIWCMTTSSIEELIAARFLQAFGACAGAVVGRAIVRDIYSADAAARALSLMMMIMAVAPMLAPIVGALVLDWQGWRAVFVVLCGFGLTCLGAVIFFAPETLAPAARIRGGVTSHIKSFGALLVHRQTMGSVLAGGFGLSGMFAYLGGSPFVYIEIFGVSEKQYSLLFALNVVGIFLMSMVTSRVVERFGWRRVLYLSTGMMTVAGLALLLLGAGGWLGLLGIVIPLFFYVGMVGSVGPSAIAGAMAAWPDRAGTASALAGVSRFAMGAVATAAVSLLHDGTVIPMVGVIAFCGVAGILSAAFMVGRR